MLQPDTEPAAWNARGFLPPLEPMGNTGRETQQTPPVAAPRGATPSAAWREQRCSLAPKGTPDRLGLLLLGFVPETEDERSDTALRAKALQWVQGLVTDKGRDRGNAVMGCGRLVPAIGANTGGVAFVRIACKDRACPACARRRARKTGWEARQAFEHRQAQWAAVSSLAEALSYPVRSPEFVFFTLTQRKRPRAHESAREAIDRLKASWRRLTNTKSKAGRVFKMLCPGGMRAMEVTWSAAGGGGFHPHLHCVGELAPGVTLEHFRSFVLSVWCTGSDAEAFGQDFRPLCETSIGQLAKYATKPLEDIAGSPDIARELFAALHGARLCEGFGAWKSWRKWVPEQDSDAEPLLLSKVQAGELFNIVNDSRKRDGMIEFVSFQGDREHRSAIEVWEALEKNRGRTWGDIWGDIAATRRVVPDAEEALANVLGYEARTLPARGLEMARKKNGAGLKFSDSARV